jgi:hypothetical protein
VNALANQQHPGRSGFVGVYWQTPKGRVPRWIAQVCTNGKIKAVPGRYETAIEAHNARCDFLAKLGFAVPAKVEAI